MEGENLKIKRLVVNGDEYDVETIKSVIPPDEEGMYWEIELIDGALIYATGNIHVKYEPIAKVVPTPTESKPTIVRHIHETKKEGV